MKIIRKKLCHRKQDITYPPVSPLVAPNTVMLWLLPLYKLEITTIYMHKHYG